MAVQVTGPVKVPENNVPFGIPAMPLLKMVNEPPAAKVPPAARLPEIKFPVVSVIVPKRPDRVGAEPKPLRPIRVDPFKVREEPLLLVICPRLLATVMEFAQAERGRASKQLNSRTRRLVDIKRSAGPRAF